jgi:hypothetical protein
MSQLLMILLAVAAIGAWWHLMQGRQRARAAAGSVCANNGVQLLDDTVSLSSVTWERSGRRSHVILRYGFEFTTNGARRRRGSVQITSRNAMNVTLELDDGRLIQALPSRHGASH